MFLKDPDPCPIDGAPHTTCCAPMSGGAIVGWPISMADVDQRAVANDARIAVRGDRCGDAAHRAADVHDKGLSRETERRIIREMDEGITVETDLFEHRQVKPHFINPCCFGEDLRRG